MKTAGEAPAPFLFQGRVHNVPDAAERLILQHTHGLLQSGAIVWNVFNIPG